VILKLCDSETLQYKFVANYILCAVCIQSYICVDLCDPNGSCPDEVSEVWSVGRCGIYVYVYVYWDQDVHPGKERHKTSINKSEICRGCKKLKMKLSRHCYYNFLLTKVTSYSVRQYNKSTSYQESEASQFCSKERATAMYSAIRINYTFTQYFLWSILIISCYARQTFQA
jgi:hypothetical protein